MKLNTIKRFIKKLPCITPKNQLGLTLLEILVVVALFSILMGISFVSYRTVTKGIKLKTLRQVAELFPNALGNCIASSGWEVTRPDGTTAEPCTDNDSATALKKIDYTCPEKAKCTFYHNDTDEYVCLNVHNKKIRGKGYEIHVIVNKNNRNDYKVLCSGKNANIASTTTLDDSICQIPSTGSYSDCEW